MDAIPIPDFCRARVLVLGCGNVLFGDDGFGPAVADRLNEAGVIPPGMCVMNVGLSCREILFTLALSDTRPRQVVVVDAVDVGRRPGEVFELDLLAIPERKIDDFSMHQIPTSNLLRELRDLCGVEVRIVAAQVRDVPESVRPGLSEAMHGAVPLACRMIVPDPVG